MANGFEKQSIMKHLQLILLFFVFICGLHAQPNADPWEDKIFLQVEKKTNSIEEFLSKSENAIVFCKLLKIKTPLVPEDIIPINNPIKPNNH